jgi:hypothetical protein
MRRRRSTEVKCAVVHVPSVYNGMYVVSVFSGWGKSEKDHVITTPKGGW